MGEMTSPSGDKVPSRLVVSEYANMDTSHQVEGGGWAKRDIKKLGQHATLHLYFVEGVTK